MLNNKIKYEESVKSSTTTDDDGKFRIITMLVADFGGGTSDFSKLILSGNLNETTQKVKWRFEGMSISGIQQFGGQDITQTIQMDLVSQILCKMTIKERDELTEEDHGEIKCDIWKQAEKAKTRLSSRKIWKGYYRWNKNKYELVMSQAKVTKLNEKHIELIKERVR